MSDIPANPVSARPAVHVHEPDPGRQAFYILQVAFVIVPLLAGIDKFTHLLVNWDKYLSPFGNNVLGGHGHEFMMAVGAIEIIAAIGVALLPRVFSWIVTIWLWLIIINLLIYPGYFDIALRDFGLSLGALALTRLSATYKRPARD